MVDRCVDPAANGMLAEALRVQFISQVPIHIVGDHKKKEQWQMECMYGYGEQEYRDNACFHNGLQWMERVCRPWGWIGGTMVHQVKDPEQSGVVHEAMCPVEISIVHEYHQDEGPDEIRDAVLMNVRVVVGILPEGGIQQDQGKEAKYGDGHNGEHDLPGIVVPLRKPVLYFPKACPVTEQHIEQQECEAGYEKIAGTDPRDDKKIFFEIHDTKFRKPCCNG